MVMKMIQWRGMSRLYLNSTVSYYSCYILPCLPFQLLCLFLALSPLVGKVTSLVKCSTSASPFLSFCYPILQWTHSFTATRRVFIYSEAPCAQASAIKWYKGCTGLGWELTFFPPKELFKSQQISLRVSVSLVKIICQTCWTFSPMVRHGGGIEEVITCLQL